MTEAQAGVESGGRFRHRCRIMHLAAESAKTLDRIVPRLYAALPRVGEADATLSGKDAPVERMFLADLRIWYAFDVGPHFEIVAHRDLTRLGIDEQALHETAMDNLRRLNLQVAAHPGERVTLLSAGGNHEAVLLLLPEVWEAVTGLATGNLVAVAPARDILLFTGDADPQNLADLRRATSHVLETAPKPLSRAFLIRRDEDWEVYRGFAD